MRKNIALASCILVALYATAQEDRDAIAARIVEEGKQLYRSEMASWYGTDVFLEKYSDRDKIGGYFSYMEAAVAKCIFFSKGEAPKVIGTISFDSTYAIKTAQADLTERDLTPAENDLFRIRQRALGRINQDTTLFKVYKNTSLNVIPIVINGEKRVYVLTASREKDVAIIGNDYLLSFDAENQLTAQRQLHQSMMKIYYGEAQSDTSQGIPFGALHTHLPETGDFITPTDICTIMLYAKLAGWKQHMVMTPKYVNIWNCETNKLLTLPREIFEKISKDQEKRKKRN
jgi:hypothetical protein